MREHSCKVSEPAVGQEDDINVKYFMIFIVTNNRKLRD